MLLSVVEQQALALFPSLGLFSDPQSRHGRVFARHHHAQMQPEHIGKGGLVKDAASYAIVRERIQQACADNGLALRGYFDSPITGGDGNREFFVYASK